MSFKLAAPRGTAIPRVVERDLAAVDMPPSREHWFWSTVQVSTPSVALIRP
jgi:hypothetical protein